MATIRWTSGSSSNPHTGSKTGSIFNSSQTIVFDKCLLSSINATAATIPFGATVTSCTFNVYIKSDANTTPDLRIYFSNSSNTIVNSRYYESNVITNSFKKFSANLNSYMNSDGTITCSGSDRINIQSYIVTVVTVKWSVYFEVEWEYEEHTHNYNIFVEETPSTCITKGSITYQCSCGGLQTTQYSLDSNNHEGGTEIKNSINAACTTEGYTGDTYCKGCGAKISSGSSIPILGHKYVVSSITPATATQDGYTTYTCQNGCGVPYISDYTINKIFIGTSQPSDIWLGESQVKGLWIGTTKVFGAKE